MSSASPIGAVNTGTASSQQPTTKQYPIKVVKTLEFLVESATDEAYLQSQNKEDDFIADILSFATDTGIALVSVDGVKL